MPQILQWELRIGAAHSSYFPVVSLIFQPHSSGASVAAGYWMQEPSEKRKRTLKLHDRALQFTNLVNMAGRTERTKRREAAKGKTEGGRRQLNFIAPISIQLKLKPQ